MKIPHEMILASAGSGKTYSLGVRYIKLLTTGADPAKIAALTFTRKAAGEFLGHILERLAQASLSSSDASKLGKDLDIKDFGIRDAQQFLRLMTHSMHNQKLGTLDGFFNRVVQCIAPELGLGGTPQLMDDFTLSESRENIWQKVFRHATQEEKQSLLHLSLENNWNEEGKQIQKSLAEFVDRNHELYLSNPDKNCWDDPYTALKKHFPWHSDPKSAQEIIENAKQEALKVNWTDAMLLRWQEFFTCLESGWNWGQPLPPESNYIIEKLLPMVQQFETGEAILKLNRKEYLLDDKCCRSLITLVSLFMGSEIFRSRQQTRMVWLLIDRYERAYQRNVRGAGMLAFADLPKLLLGSFADIERELIYFRLDGQIDHWLLDEFQDTSRTQWNALAEWIDEVLQDPEYRRTFFYVGDVKQSIYGWRGGDPYLFNEIFDHYHPAIQSRRLDLSWRSCPAVLNTVNALFSNFGFMEESFPDKAVARWKSIWGQHEPSPDTKGKAGYSAVWEAQEKGLEAKLPAIAEMLHKMSPTKRGKRGLSCAILTQSNAEVEVIIQYLREQNVPVSREGEMTIVRDNDLGSYLLAWFQLAAHPSDTLASTILLMHELVSRHLHYNRSDLTAHADALREKVYQSGYEEGALGVIESVEKFYDLDEFHKLRRRQLLKMAADFDQSGIKDIAKFVSFIRSYSIREASETSSVQVMTIHKSKGLGFDIVILPSLKGDRLDSMRRGSFLFPGQSAADSPWVFKSPVQKFADIDPALSSAMSDRSNDACFEKFCQLYVATTRAKRALLIFSDKAPKSSNSANFEKWIRESLPLNEDRENHDDDSPILRYSSGDENWFDEYPMRKDLPPETPQKDSIAKITTPEISTNLKHQTVTDGAKSGYRTRLNWSGRGNAKQRGTQIHERLAKIEWLKDEEAFDYPAIRDIFKKPAQSVDVWRESAFELLLDDTWISGVFDRVHLLKDSNGNIVDAAIYDFKTDNVKSGQEPERATRYTHQMQTYAKALSHLVNMPSQNIKLKLVFLTSQCIFDVAQ